MKYYIDTEFNETFITKEIELISIGIVCEDGREYYAVNRDFKFDQLNDWVKENVLPQLSSPDARLLSSDPNVLILDRFKKATWKPGAAIAKEILAFVGADPYPEFWGYYSSTDWVIFYQLFGTLMTLPRNFPRRCNDVQQEYQRYENLDLPEHSAETHNALEDARWIKQAHESLVEQSKNRILYLSE